VRRLILSLCLLSLTASLAACGPKTVHAAIPKKTAPAQSDLVGLASYYAEPYNGRKTASGEVFDAYNAMTAAHRTLPFDTVVRVINQKNGLEVDVRINDRGPFVEGRVIDLSLAAARKIDMVRDGVAPVELKVLKVEAKQPADPAAPRSPTAPPGYQVQVAAFETLDAAEELRRNLEKRYKNVHVEKADLDKTYYRVRIPQADEKSAQHVVEELRKDDFRPYIVRGN
jgi:rare lipoprotein A